LQFFPYHCFFRESILAGQLPLWNPYIYGGMSFIGCLQSAIFYPLNWLLLWIPAPWAITASVLLHVYLLGAFTYLLLKQWGSGDFGALLGATTMMLSGFTACRMEYPTVLAAATWLPLLIALIDQYLEEGRSWFFLPLVVAVDLCAGHLQITLISLGFAFAYALMRFHERRKGAPTVTNAGQSLWRLTFAMLTGVLLAAPQLLPTWETLINSTRSTVSFDFASIYSLPPWQMITLLFPNCFGNPNRSFYWGDANFWELTAYTGIIGLLFASSAISGWSRSKEKAANNTRVLFLCAMAILGLVISLGKFTPLYGWLYRAIPGFASFKGPGRCLFVFVFAISLLVGIGGDRVVRHPAAGLPRLSRWAARATVALACLLSALVIGKDALLTPITRFVRWQFPRIEASLGEGEYPRVAQGIHAVWLQDVVTALILMLLFWVITKGASRGKISSGRWAVGAFCLVVFDLLLFACSINPWTTTSLFEKKSHLAHFLQTRKGEFRILTRPSLRLHVWGTFVPFTKPAATGESALSGLRESLAPNLCMLYHLVDIEGYDPLKPEVAQRRLDRINSALDSSGDVDPLTEAGVRFVIGYRESLHSASLRKVWERNGLEVYENLQWRAAQVRCRSKPYLPQSFRLGLFIGLNACLLWSCLIMNAFTKRRVGGRGRQVTPPECRF